MIEKELTDANAYLTAQFPDTSQNDSAAESPADRTPKKYKKKDKKNLQKPDAILDVRGHRLKK